jgi:hypothetical protein
MQTAITAQVQSESDLRASNHETSRLTDDNSTVVRYCHALLFVGLWVGLGIVLKLDPNAYLLAGVPLTIGFQLLVRRRPLSAMWVRQAPPFRLGRLGALLAVGLLIVPVKELSAPGSGLQVSTGRLTVLSSPLHVG